MSREIQERFETARLSITPLVEADAPALQGVFEAAGDYFLSITGRPEPDDDAAVREIRSCAAADGREVALLSLRGSGDHVGALGWWENHPEPGVALIGMILVVPAERGKGLAREALEGLEERLAGRGVTRLRTGVGAGEESKHALLAALGFGLLTRTHIGLDRGRMMLAIFEKPIE